MKYVPKPLAAILGVGALLTLAACDQNSQQQTAGDEGAEIVAELPEDNPADAAGDAARGCQAAADALGGVWIGRPFAEAESGIMAGEGVATIRVIRPGTAVTKDFRIDRLNVDVDESGKITRIYCG